MANTTENRYLNVYIQSGKAQEALDQLLSKQKRLNDELAKTNDPKKLQGLQQQLARLEEPISRASKKLSGDLNPTLKDTEASVKSLGDRLKNMSADDADFSNVIAQYKQGSKELDEQRAKAGLLHRTMRSFWQEAKATAAGVLIGNSIQSLVQSIYGFIGGIITGSAKISRELTGIAKTTGLTGKEVRRLNDELNKIDTETSASQLRELAKEAGKLGHESVEDVLKFVKEADQINVALGEDLGQDAIVSIGKLSKIFKVSMLQVGSAINEVGANSEASEKFAVDFLNMVSGVGPALKVSAGDLLGYGAALEIGGQQAEKSGTAINNFLIDFVRDADKFGAAAGFAKGELRDLINTKGTNEAFLQFLTRLKQANPEADKFLSKMQEIGVDGSRGANALLVLANNIEGVRTQQKVANGALTEGTSLTKEFNKVNNDAQAELNKLGKDIKSFFTSSTFQAAGEAAIRIIRGFITAISNIPEFINQNKFALLTLAAGILLLNGAYVRAGLSAVSFRIVQIAGAAANAILTVSMNIARAAVIAYTIATSGAATGMTIMQRAALILRTAMAAGAGPIGAVLVGVGALVIAIGNLFSRTKELTAAQKLQADIQKRVVESTTETIGKIDLLTKVAGDNNRSLDDRKKALNALIAIAPEYLKGLTLENLATKEGANLIARYVDNLKVQAELEAKRSILIDKLKDKQNTFNELRSIDTRFKGLSDDDVEKELRRRAALSVNIISGVQKRTDQGIAESIVEQLDVIKGLQNDVAKASVQTIVSANSGADAVTQTTNQVGESIDSLKKKLEDLQKQRDASTSDPERKRLNDDITATEKRIAELEGRKDKVVAKTENDIEKLKKELQDIKNNLSLNTLSSLDKELGELDIKYQKLADRAKGNNKLLVIIQELHEQEKLQVIRAAARKAVDEWQKESDKGLKAQEDTLKKNLAAIKAMADNLSNLTINSAKDFGADKLAKDGPEVMKSTGKSKLEAELKLLNEQENQELISKDHTENEKLLIEETYRQKRQQAEMNYWVGLVNNILNFAQQISDIGNIIAKSRSDKENAELESDKKSNDRKKQNLDRRLKAGTISQLQYNREIDKMEKDREKKEHEIAIRQFKRQQKADIIQALINGALGVTGTLAAPPGPFDIATLGVLRAIQVGLVVATTAAQIASISSRKPPEMGHGGAYLQGPSHSDKTKGMPVVNPYTGAIQAYLEGGEGVTNKRTMSDRSKYNIEGTPSQIISWLNARHGGVHWESGAKLTPAWHYVKPPSFNFPALRQYYALGGVTGKVNNTPAAASEESGTNMMALLMALLKDQIATNEEMRDTLSSLQGTLMAIQKEGIVAEIPITNFNKQKKRYDDIVSAATGKV